MAKKLILFPFGGNAKEAVVSILAINELSREWEVAGFIDDDPSSHGKRYCGIPVLGGREQLRNHADALVLAVPGSPRNYLDRRSIIEELSLDESRYATIVHPSVVRAPDAVVGYNTLLMPHVFVSCATRIGNHCVVLPNTVISHDSVVDDYCCIGSNVSVSGSVRIGSECYVGSGVRVREKVMIGNRSLIGLGSNVVTDIEEGDIVVGNPARTIKRISIKFPRRSAGIAAKKADLSKAGQSS